MSTPAHIPYAVWAIPAPGERQRLLAVFRYLAERDEGPAFEPHVTLCSGDAAPEDPLESRLMELAGDLAPFSADVGEVVKGDSFFTALFARVTMPDDLLGKSARAFPGSHRPRVGAHLSLLYADASPAIDRTVMADTVARQLPATLRFDTLLLVHPTTGSWSDVSRWRRLASEPLRTAEWLPGVER
jgi:hypothetical protein